MRSTTRSTSAPTTGRSTRWTRRPARVRWTYHAKGAIEEARRRRRRHGLLRDRRRSRDRARRQQRQVALAVRARDARGVHDPRLLGPAHAGRGRDRRLLRRLPGVAERRQRRGRLGAVAGRGFGSVRRRRFDADHRRATRSTRRPTRAGSTRSTRKDGAIRWRVGIEGVSSVYVAGSRIYFAAPREGLHAADTDGHILWRQGLTAGGRSHDPGGGRARTWSSRAAERACSSSTARPASCSRSSTPAAASAPRPRSIRPAAASTFCRTAARSMRWT